jgi:phosphatidylserine/phosphatidylglycerophosphate/cardiolipin synthase-like enzyme
VALLIAAAVFGARAGAAVAQGPAARAEAAGAPIRLIESVPIETGLGNPELPRALDVWLELIRGARSSLDFEQFYLSNWPGEPMEPVLKAIGEAAGRGVRVRLLLDRRMHETYPMPADSLGRLPGIEVRSIDFGPLAGGVQHSKYFLVDRATVVVGSQNFDWRALEHIHELGVAVRDARLARIFGDVFEADWALGVGVTGVPGAGAAGAPGAVPHDRAIPAPADSAARMLARRALAGGARVEGLPLVIVQSPGDTALVWPSYSPRGWIPDSTLWDRDAVVRLIDGARRTLAGQVLTYSPVDRRQRDDGIQDALKRAAARGVRVRLVISDWEGEGDPMRALQELSALPGVEIRRSSVPEWSGGYIPFARVEHCKYLVADSDRVWVSTSNLDPGYFYGTRNLSLTIQNAPLARAALRGFEPSWDAAAGAPITSTSRFAPSVHGEQPPPGHKRHGE